MKPTSRGLKIIIILIMILALAVLFSDNILLFCSLFLASLLLAALLDTVRKIKRAERVIIEPPILDLKLVAGNEGKAYLKFQSEVAFRIDIVENWICFQPSVVRPPEMIVTLSIKPMLSGVYELSNLKIKVHGFLELFQACLAIPIQLRLEAYPRVLPWMLEALNLLGEARAGIGDIPGKRRGRGLEYLWSREYQVGDDISLIDWKATARHRKIFVKEFLEETYGSVKIIYDIRAHGPITNDECSAYFLSAVVSASVAGLPVSITIKNGNDIIVDRDELNFTDALKLAVAYVVENYLTNKWNVYELFDPKSARMVLRISKEVGSEAFTRVAELKLSEFLRNLSKTMKDGRSAVIYIGCILIDSDFVINLAAEASRLGGRIIILSPLKPWLDAKNLEEAYLMYQSSRRVLRTLRNMEVSLTLTEFHEFLT